MMNVKLAWLLTLALGCPWVAHAKLSFPVTSVLVKATPDDQVLRTKYAFTNSGPEPIDILTLGASCGCTVPTTDKMHYAPGESGTIAVTYTIGASEGPQTQTVSVITTETTDNLYSLTFNAELPRGLKTNLPVFVPITPRLLYWRKKPFETKTVTVDLKATPVTKLTVTCDREDVFQIQTKDTPGRHGAIIEVTPTAGATGETQAELTVNLETASGKLPPAKVALRIFPEKTAAAPKN